MALESYKKKRNFRKTPEPKGKKSVSAKYKNLYIIQKHAASHLHYDFRLELNGVLLSWAVPKGPCLDPAVKRLAMHTEDHPVEYGNFEGIIPEGEYGGGTVMLWDKGKWICEDENPLAAYRKGHLKFTLQAEKLNGRWNLVRSSKDEKAWFLIKSSDEFAKPLSKYDITVKEPDSVKSHLTLQEITDNYKNIWSKHGSVPAKRQKKKVLNKIKIDLSKKSMPATIHPQLATLVDKPPQEDHWIHELKFDGYRIIAFKRGKDVRLISRNNKDWTRYFPNIQKAVSQLPVKNLILDGEVVVLDAQQKSSFQLLQNAIGNHEESFVYYIFDLLYYDKYNLMSSTLGERKNILKNLSLVFDENTLRYSDHVMGSGDTVFKNACKMGLEGIVCKDINSNYEQRRTKTWLKVKCVHRQELVIGGFSPPQGSRAHFGSLYLGYFDKKKNFIFCGNVGTGFNQTSLKEIYSLLKKNITDKNPFTTRPPGVTTAIWVKPVLVAEIEFSEWTQDGSLRHPSFKGLRLDKKAGQITRETQTKIKTIEKDETKSMTKKSNVTIELSHPDKILYPETKITKQDIANYYIEIQQWIMPYVTNRLLTLVRCPENYKKCFYQKHLGEANIKGLYEIPIKEKNKTDDYIYIKDLSGLLALVQMGVLEIHPWGSTIDDVENPDMIIFDLDPAPDVAWKRVVATAKRIRKYLEEYNLQSFVKTTGGKGLHVVVPIKPEHDWETIKNFAHAFVQVLVEKYPEEYVSEMSKAKRTGKIFIDYLRNQRGATAICAYSLRARKGAPVSMPLEWDELDNNAKVNSFDIHSALKRLSKLKKDPWQKFFKIKQKLRLKK